MFLRRYRRTNNGKTIPTTPWWKAFAPGRATTVGRRPPEESTMTRKADAPSCSQSTGRRSSAPPLPRTNEQVDSPDDPDVVRISLNLWVAQSAPIGDVCRGWPWRHLKLDEILDRHVAQGKRDHSSGRCRGYRRINRLRAVHGVRTGRALVRFDGPRGPAGRARCAVTKDRLYRTLDRLLGAQGAIEGDLKERPGTRFQLDYGLVLYDLTSTYFEGLAEENELVLRPFP